MAENNKRNNALDDEFIFTQQSGNVLKQKEGLSSSIADNDNQEELFLQNVFSKGESNELNFSEADHTQGNELPSTSAVQTSPKQAQEHDLNPLSRTEELELSVSSPKANQIDSEAVVDFQSPEVESTKDINAIRSNRVASNSLEQEAQLHQANIVNREASSNENFQRAESQQQETTQAVELKDVQENTGAVAVDINVLDATEDISLRINTADLLANNTDAGGDTLTISAVTATDGTHGTVELVNKVVFEDNFDDNNAEGWNEISFNGRDLGRWDNGNGAIGERSNSARGIIAHEMGNNATSTDYSISVDIDANTGRTGNNGVGLVFNYEDSNNYYQASWDDYSTNYSANSSHKDFNLIKVVDGVKTVLDTVDTAELPDTFQLNVSVDENGISIKVDGTEMLSSTEQPELGTIGLWTYDNDGGVAYDNISVAADTTGKEIVFTPEENYNGEASFEYTVSGGQNGIVTLDIEAVNDAPVITIVDTTATEDSAQIIATVADLEGTIDSSTLNAEHGTVTLDNEGNITYTPDADYNGADTVSLSITDDEGATIAQTINLTIDPTQDTPVAVDDSLSTRENNSLMIKMSKLIANDTDVDNDTLTLTDVGATANTHGSVELVDTHAVSLDGGGDYVSMGTLNLDNSFTISASVQLDSISGRQIIVGERANGLDNWFGISNGKVECFVTESADVNNVSVTGTTTLNTTDTYDLSAVVNGNTVTLYVNGVEEASRTVDFNIAGWNGDNVIGQRSNGQFSFEGEISEVQIHSSALDSTDVASIANGNTLAENIVAHYDFEGDSLSEQLSDKSGNGHDGTAQGDAQVVIDGGQMIKFTPDANYTGDASFEYTISDGQGGTDTATVTLNVDANQVITQVTDTDNSNNEVTENVVNGTYTGVTLSASDADGDAITYSLSDDVPFTIDENGRIITDGAIDFETNESFSFIATASSSDGTTSTESMTISINDQQNNIDGSDDTVSLTGTRGDDSITLSEGEGHTAYQVVRGGEGTDTVIFEGNRGDYTVTHEDGNGRFVMKNIATGEANYIYDDVETIQFSDQSIATFTDGALTTTLVNDVVSGTDAHLSTGSGDDTITLSEGEGHTAYQVVRGGDGTDTVIFEGNRGDYTVTHEDGNGRFVMKNIATGEANYIYDDVETIQFADQSMATFTDGTPTTALVNDVISGTDSHLSTGSGDDTITLSEGEGHTAYQVVRGGDGTDTVIFEGNRGDYTVTHEDGNGRFKMINIATGEANYIYDDVETMQFADQSMATFTDGSPTTTLVNDVISGTDAHLSTGSGDDTITLSEGEGHTAYQVVRGGDGNDTVIFEGNRGDYTVTHEDGNGRFKMINIATGEANYIYDDVETMQFADQSMATFTDGTPTTALVNDVISGTDSHLSTGSGDDTITLSEGEGHTAYQVVRGGDGTDTVIFEGNRGDYTVTHEDGNGRFKMINIATGEANYIYDDVETMQFADQSLATFTDGTPTTALVNDVISGTDSHLSTGSGDDRITLSEGEGHTAYQVVRGGDGTDTVIFEGNRGDYTVTHEDGNGRFKMINIATGEANYIYDDVETMQFADQSLATFTDGTPTTALVNDVISGTDSHLSTGSGDDTITLSEGEGHTAYQVVRGGEGTDTVIFEGNRTDYTVTHDDGNGRFLMKNIETGESNYIYDDVETIQFADQSLASFTDGAPTPLLVSNAQNEIQGTSSSETLNGTDSSDYIWGEQGNDTINAGDRNDVIEGGEGDDSLNGGAGNDTILGGDGNDSLIGGSGDDTVSGGSGSDTYFFNAFDGNDTFQGGDGWTDIVNLNEANSADPDASWTVTVDGAEVAPNAGESFIDFGEDTSGVVTMADGSTLGFEGVERVEW